MKDFDMKKIAAFLMVFCLVQSASNSYALDVSEVAKKAAQVVLTATVKMAEEAKGCVCDIVSVINEKSAWGKFELACRVIVFMFYSHRLYLFLTGDDIEKIKNKQKCDFYIAKQNLINIVQLHAHDKIGSSGLPEACEQAACALVMLPGGETELERIKLIFQRYFVLPDTAGMN
jgi:hypothetical protein